MNYRQMTQLYKPAPNKLMSKYIDIAQYRSCEPGQSDLTVVPVHRNGKIYTNFDDLRHIPETSVRSPKESITVRLIHWLFRS